MSLPKVNIKLDKLNSILSKLPFYRLNDVLAVCLEEHVIKMVELGISGSKPVIKNYAILQIPHAESQEEQAQVFFETFKTAYEKGGFKAKLAFITLMSGSVFLRKVTLPQIPKNELKEAIRWEADNQIPFSMDSAYLDWQFLAEEKNKDGLKNNQYMIAAAAKATIDFILEVFKTLGIEIVCIGLPAFAIQSIYMKCTQVHPGEDVAFVDIGAKKTNIVIFRGKVLSFAREIPIGHDTLDDILYTELPALKSKGDRGYIDAIKSSCDFMTIQDRSEELIPGLSNHRIYSSFSLFFERLLSEMSRSFDYFKTQVGDFGLCKIYVTGVGSNLINIDRYLRSKFDVPVEKIKVANNFEFDRSVNKDTFLENFQSLQIAIGTAMGQFNQINFLPVKFEEKVKKRLYSFILAGILTVLILIWVASSIFFNLKIQGIRNDIKALKDKVTATEPQIKELERVCKEFDEEHKIFKKLESDRVYLAAVLKFISNNIPRTLTVSEFNFEDSVLTISGYVFEDEKGLLDKNNVLVDFIIALKDSELISDANLVQSEKGTTFSLDHNIFSVECQLISKSELFELIG